MGTAVMATSQRPLCSLLLPKSGSLLAGGEAVWMGKGRGGWGLPPAWGSRGWVRQRLGSLCGGSWG